MAIGNIRNLPHSTGMLYTSPNMEEGCSNRVRPWHFGRTHGILICFDSRSSQKSFTVIFAHGCHKSLIATVHDCLLKHCIKRLPATQLAIASAVALDQSQRPLDACQIPFRLSLPQSSDSRGLVESLA